MIHIQLIPIRFKMGHDIDLVDIKTRRIYGSTYITGNFSKYGDKYPGIYAIHGHSNETVIKIIKASLTKLLNDDIIPRVHNPGGRALTFGVPGDEKKDLECYAACLQEFLQVALKFKDEYPETHGDIYWYSDQVWEITKYVTDSEFVDNGYESDGKKLLGQKDVDSGSDLDSD